MLTMDQINHITSLYKIEGLSLREIRRRTGYHIDTIKKYIDKEDFSEPPKVKNTRPSKLDPLKPVIDEWLTIDLKVPRKQHHTASKVYKRLVKEYPEQLQVKKRIVQQYVSDKKHELHQGLKECYFRIEHPDDEAQVDFGEFDYYDKDKNLKKAYHLVMSYPNSNSCHCQTFLGQNQECLLTGIQTIFEYISKVPGRIVFDNLSAAVVHIEKDKERKLTEQFLKFKLHYGFDSVFCNPGKGNEKGNVETKVGYDRRNFFVPVPTIKDFDEFNKDLLKICDEDMERPHYLKQESILELFKHDINTMRSLPKTPFKVCRLIKAKTDKYSFATFDRNKYSTSPNMAQCEVWIECTASKVRILSEDYKEIAVHKRAYEKLSHPIQDWESYIPSLIRKPMAFRYTSFFKELPQIWQDYFESSDYRKSKQMIKLLGQIIIEGKIPEATQALKLAKQSGSDDTDSFLACYRRLSDSAEEIFVVTALTPHVKAYIPDIKVYDTLMGV